MQPSGIWGAGIQRLSRCFSGTSHPNIDLRPDVPGHQRDPSGGCTVVTCGYSGGGVVVPTYHIVVYTSSSQKLAPFMTSFHYSIAFLIILYGPSLCMVYIYISAYCSSPRYDNYTPKSGWWLGSAFLLLCFLLLVSLTVSTFCFCFYVCLLSL